MFVSAFDLFKIGLGPSSSHTVGPMRAAQRFVRELAAEGKLDQTTRVFVDLYGALGLNGRGHGTDRAVLLGLCGESPESIDPDQIPAKVQAIRQQRILVLDGRWPIPFREQDDLRFRIDKSLAFHSNAMRFTALGAGRVTLARKLYFSLGGGVVIDEQQAERLGDTPPPRQLPYPFLTTAELLRHGTTTHKRIPDIMRANELVLHSPEQLRSGLLRLWTVMNESIERGMAKEGVLSGGLDVRRRAKGLREELLDKRAKNEQSSNEASEWASMYAVAVSEENAAGGRVVAAPTNGAAGVVPAVIRYYRDFCEEANDEGVVVFLLTAAAIGGLCKRNLPFSGVDVGCQGEVGVACSMAAAGLAAALGASNWQIENAAAIGLESLLGASCDPVMGLVQSPCIERNATGAASAVNAASLALHGESGHRIALDTMIKKMYEAGREMTGRYKETSLGGFAVNVVEC